MALDMFLKFGDKVKGESGVKGHENETEILAWSFGASNSGTLHYATGGGAGKANIQDLSITKYLDGSSADLLKCCVTGEHLANAVLTMRRAGGIDAGQVPMLTMTLTKCMITSYSTGGSGGEDRLTENITVNFAEIHYEPKKQGDTGGEETAGDFKYNIATQVLG